MDEKLNDAIKRRRKAFDAEHGNCGQANWGDLVARNARAMLARATREPTPDELDIVADLAIHEVAMAWMK